jgi:predicted NAD/FAD-binding protein
VVLACHSDQALRLLGSDATPRSAACWAPSATSPTRPCCTPIQRAAAPRGSLGGLELRTRGRRREQAGVCLHYLINRLQPLPWQQPVMVSLNPVRH